MLSRPSSAAEPSAAQGRIAGRGPVGVIDIGSNSVRLVVYERLARSPTPLFNEKILAGLGSGVAETGSITADAAEKTRGALRRFAALARQMGVAELDVVATAAIREAENGAEFIVDVEAICGCPVKVLSGEEEARIAALGVVAELRAAGRRCRRSWRRQPRADRGEGARRRRRRQPAARRPSACRPDRAGRSRRLAISCATRSIARR